MFSVGVGLNILSLLMLLVGLAGGADSRMAVLIGAIGIVAASAWVTWKDRRRHDDSATNAGAREVGHPESSWLLLAGLPFVVFTLLGGMLPASDFDVREYHLQAPKEFFLAGRITFLPHNVYANMPLGTEMHSLSGMVILDDWWSGALVGKTVQACFVPLAGLALLAAGRRWTSNRVGVWAAVIYVSTPWIVHVATAGLVEAAAAFYLCAALFALLLWRERREKSFLTVANHSGASAPLPSHLPGNREEESPDWQQATPERLLLLAGFLAGSAVAAKYPAALFVVVPLAALTCWWGQGRRVRATTMFLLIVAVGCGPWLLKNAWLTGNPSYPLLYEVFGGSNWTAEKDAQWNTAHRPPNFALFDSDDSIPRNLAESVTDVFVRSPWLNFVTWPFALAALAFLRRQRVVGVLWGYVLFVVVAWWLLTHRIDRFWVPMLSIASLLAGIGACLYDLRAWRVVAGIALAIALIYDFTLVVTNTGPGSSNRFFVPLARLRQDPERLRPWQLWLNEQTPAGKGVLSEGDAAVFDLEMPVAYHTAFDDSPLLQLIEGKTPEECRAALADFAFVYVNWNEINRYRSPGNYGYTKLVQPKLFEALVQQGVLGPPIAASWGPGVEIYPVR